MKYKSIFIDLDDTVWAFSENAKDTLFQNYNVFGYERFFSSFAEFYNIYKERNTMLWIEYGKGNITKEELNDDRFSYPLIKKGIKDNNLSKCFAAAFFKEIVKKKKLMPYAFEALEYLYDRYNLYILSNGFRELQYTKIMSSGIDGFFKKIILSEDAGVHKPYKELFEYALTEVGAKAQESLMIGDSWENDVVGAKNAGLGQGYYNIARTECSFHPSFVFYNWKEIKNVL